MSTPEKISDKTMAKLVEIKEAYRLQGKPGKDRSYMRLIEIAVLDYYS
jgi:hypothetical protein